MPAVTTTANMETTATETTMETTAMETAVEATMMKVMMMKGLKPETDPYGNAVGVIRK